MGLFHRHVFSEVINRQYFPPSEDAEATRVRGLEALRLMERILTGYTIITRQCTCGKLSQQTLLGNVP